MYLVLPLNARAFAAFPSRNMADCFGLVPEMCKAGVSVCDGNISGGNMFCVVGEFKTEACGSSCSPRLQLLSWTLFSESRFSLLVHLFALQT